MEDWDKVTQWAIETALRARWMLETFPYEQFLGHLQKAPDPGPNLERLIALCEAAILYQTTCQRLQESAKAAAEQGSEYLQ